MIMSPGSGRLSRGTLPVLLPIMRLNGTPKSRFVANTIHWVRSSLSFANGNCVEVADLSGGEIGVRNSRDSAGPVLRFTRDEWHAFIGGVRNGEFDGFGGIS
jgi:hypothetical protein